MLKQRWKEIHLKARQQPALSVISPWKAKKNRIIDQKIMNMKKLLYIIFATLCIQHGFAQVDRGNVLIKGGTVITITKGTLEATDVLITEGKIAQVGKNIAAPASHKVIDANGMFVMPGI